MNELKVVGTQEFMGVELPVIEGGFGEGLRVMTTKQIAKLHNMENFNVNKLVASNIDEFEEGVDILEIKAIFKDYSQLIDNLGYSIDAFNASKNIYILSEQGYSKLMSIRKDRSTVVEVLDKYFKTNINIPMKFGRKELRFMKELKDVLQVLGFTLITQYHVLKYRIDGYIPELNIAIEYDENSHVGYSFEEHEYRQEKIEKLINCKFIRVTDNSTIGKNIGIIIKILLNTKQEVL